MLFEYFTLVWFVLEVVCLLLKGLFYMVIIDDIFVWDLRLEEMVMRMFFDINVLWDCF